MFLSPSICKEKIALFASLILPWAHGLQTCRSSYDQEGGFWDQVQKLNASEIPFDSDCLGADVMLTAFDFSSEFVNLREDFQLLNSLGKKFVLHQPVVATKPPNFDGFVKTNNGTGNYITTIRDRGKDLSVVLPDFLRPDTNDWFSTKTAELVSKLEGFTVRLNRLFLGQHPTFDFGFNSASKGRPE